MTAVSRQVSTAEDDNDWPDIATPGTVDPATLTDTYPDEATTGGPAYWAARPHQPRMGHLPAGCSPVTSLADWKRRRQRTSEAVDAG